MQPSERESAILTHLPLVHRLVRRVTRRVPDCMDKESLLGAGMVGLIQAVDAFDQARGVPFETYARIRIKGAVQDELRHMDYLTRDQRKLARTVVAARDALTRTLGRDVVEEEVAAAAKVSVDEVRQAAVDQAGPQAVDPWIMDETVTGTPWQEQQSAEATLADKQAMLRLQGALTRLTEREQLAMALYYDEGLTLAEIGEILHISQSRVSQILTEVKNYLRDELAD